MNAQHSITTTPKYNFPLPKENLQLPQRLIELSLQSLKEPYPSHPSREDTQAQFSTIKDPNDLLNEENFVKLKPNPAKTPIVAIDVSSIRLGETKTGTLLGVRGAMVWKESDKYRYLRLGPFPFHVTAESQSEILSTLNRTHQKKCLQDFTFPNIVHMQTRLTTLLERWMQTLASKTAKNSLILLDGSLAENTLETSAHSIERLLKEARNHRNTILAFSKGTQLSFQGYRITDLVWSHPPPCLLKIEDVPMFASSIHQFGDVYVAKLSGDKCAFRLDVDRELPHFHVAEAVQKLLGNDLILQSYPETLRLAHIFSTFTANEVLGIQRWVAKEQNVKIVSRPNVRRLLFGCFGKGPAG